MHCYRCGLPVSDVKWRMRLKNQATLGYYLQEVGAITALGGLSEVARKKGPESGVLLRATPFAPLGNLPAALLCALSVNVQRRSSS